PKGIKDDLVRITPRVMILPMPKALPLQLGHMTLHCQFRITLKARINRRMNNETIRVEVIRVAIWFLIILAPLEKQLFHKIPEVRRHGRILPDLPEVQNKRHGFPLVCILKETVLFHLRQYNISARPGGLRKKSWVVRVRGF